MLYKYICICFSNVILLVQLISKMETFPTNSLPLHHLSHPLLPLTLLCLNPIHLSTLSPLKNFDWRLLPLITMTTSCR